LTAGLLTDIFLIAKVKQEVEFFISGIKQKGSFTRNFSYVFSGKIVIVLFSVLTTPILTRIYSPEAYGYFAFANTIAVNFSIISTFGFPQALVLKHHPTQFYNLTAATIALCFLMLIVFTPLMILTFDFLVPFNFTDGKALYIASVITFCFLLSMLQIFPKWNVWRSQFKLAGTINVIVNGGGRAASLGFGFLARGFPYGILAGEIIGKVLGVLLNVLINVWREWPAIVASVSPRRMRVMVRKYRDYPKFVLTGNYLVVLTAHLPLLIFPFFFDIKSVGQFSLAMGLLSLPSILLIQPMSTLLQNKLASIDQTNVKHFGSVVDRAVFGLYAISVLPFSIVIVFGAEIFSLVLGQIWFTSGIYAGILAIGVLFDMMSTMACNALLVNEKRKMFFLLNGAQLAATLIALLPGVIFDDLLLAVYGIAISKLLTAGASLYHVFRLCRLSARELLMKYILIVAVVIAFLYGIRLLLT
jgi:O-antigen/teichoic acid export membrane protein